MQIVSINEHALERFLALSDQTNLDKVNALRTQMLDLWTNGHSRPAWCFLAQANGIDVGRVAYRRGDLPQEISPYALQLPWQADYLAVGKALLRESLKIMATQGAQRVVRPITSQWETANAQQQVFAAAGFSLHQTQAAFALPMPAIPVVVPERLSYRSLEEVGEVAFIEAMRQARAYTLDSDDQKVIAQIGPQQAAENLFAQFQIDYWVYQPAWWQLAYAADGALVGFVQPLIFRETPQTGTIGYIGVVPEQRGHHYVDDLLLKAHRILQEAGVQELIDGTDSENFPMIAAFHRAGYKDNGTHWIYQFEFQ